MISLFFAFLSSPTFAFEGHHVGNGGDVVACYENAAAALAGETPKSVELLDFQEAREFRHLSPDLSSASDVDGKVHLSLSRLHQINPSREARYERFFSTFYQDAMFVNGKNLTDIPDSEHLFIEKNCRLIQIAIQETPRFQGDPRYVIDRDLWNLLSGDGKASLIVHELIWRELREASVENSIPVRYLNSLLFADRLKGLSLKAFVDLAVALHLPDYDAEGLIMALCRPSADKACVELAKPIFRDDNHLWAAFVEPSAPAWDSTLKVQSLKWQGQSVRVAGPIRFAPPESKNSAKPLTVILASPYGSGALSVAGQEVRFQGYAWAQLDCRKDWSCAQNVKDSQHRLLFSAQGSLLSLTSPQQCEGGVAFLKETGAVESCQK